MSAGWRISCPCGNRGRVGDEQAFETRGKLGGTPVQRCLRCGGGLLVLLPRGRVRPIPADQWAEMERAWIRTFPEDAPSSGPPATIEAFDPMADGPGAVAAGEVFWDALAAMRARTDDRHDLHPNGRALANACLEAAASTAHDLAEASDPDDDGIDRAIARLAYSDDQTAAARLIYGLSWYFAFGFQGSALASVDRDRWLDAVQEALDPTGAHRLGDTSALPTLFNAYVTWRANPEAPFAIAWCRWILRHLSNEDDEPDVVDALLLLQACQGHLGEVVAELTDRTHNAAPAAPAAPAAAPNRPAIQRDRRALGWVVDLLLGWLIGSVLGGLAIGVVLVALDANDTIVPNSDGSGAITFSQLGVLVGTVLVVWLLRRRRARRRAAY